MDGAFCGRPRERKIREVWRPAVVAVAVAVALVALAVALVALAVAPALATVSNFACVRGS